MKPGFVEYLEENASAIVGLTSAAVTSLATALQTTTEALSGGGRERPAGRGRPGVSSTLTVLSEDECGRLIAPGGVGRVAFTTADELLVLPVNFRVVDREIVFRTATDSVLVRAAEAQRVSFEVDHLDEASGEGWSVLAQGASRIVSDPEEQERLDRAGIEPWAGGERPLFMCVEPATISGRRIQSSW